MIDILEQVRNCVGSAFRVDPAQINEQDSQDTIKDWDSVGQIQLILELESQFGLNFSLDEIVSIRSIGDIVRLIAAKRGV